MMEINFDSLRENTMNNANDLAHLIDNALQKDSLTYEEKIELRDTTNELLLNVFTIGSCFGENQKVNNVQGSLMPYFLEEEYD